MAIAVAARDLERAAVRERAFARRADRVAQFGGSWAFLFLFGLFMVAWVALDSVVLIRRRHLPGPGTILLPPPERATTGRDRASLVVFYSGDGGWIAKIPRVCRLLRRQGHGVVGIDSLRYFRAARDPAESAADLAELIERLSARWRTEGTIVGGYSFGAGVVPFVVNRLPVALRGGIRLVVLAGLGREAPFRFTLRCWLSTILPLVHEPRGLPVGEELERLTEWLGPDRVLCTYGLREREPPCLGIEGVRTVRLTGGHYFGWTAEDLAGRILAAIRGGDRAPGR